MRTSGLRNGIVLAGSVMLLGTLAPPAAAQARATFVMRSGERMNGQLVDMNASGLVVRARGGEQSIATSELAVIDFAGGGRDFPQAEVDASGRGHLLVTRDGGFVTGRLADISGTTTLRIVMDTGGGQRDFAASDVSRIYLSKPPQQAASPIAPPTGGGVRVPASARWVNTGYYVTQGQTATFKVTGEVRLSGDAADVASAAGSKQGRMAGAGAPMPGTLAGALIGRIGNGQAFGIGDQGSIRVPGTGQLSLMVNDDHLPDNSGEFAVEITVIGPPPRR